jgi:hypothetical protein
MQLSHPDTSRGNRDFVPERFRSGEMSKSELRALLAQEQIEKRELSHTCYAVSAASAWTSLSVAGHESSLAGAIGRPGSTALPHTMKEAAN